MNDTSTNFLLRNNTLINNQVAGAAVEDIKIADYFSVTNNFIDNNGNGGFLARYNDGPTFAIINNIITSCNDNGAPSRGGISLDGNGFVTLDIIGNTLNNHFDQGIKIQSSNFTTFNVINNTMNNNGDAASESGFSMQTTTVEDVTISSNAFSSNYDNGMQLQGCSVTASMSIRNNSLTGNSGDGINLSSPASSLDYLFIGDNFIVSNASDFGFVVDGYSVNSLMNVKNNIFRNNNYRAFHMMGGASATLAITDNLIASHGEMGFGLGMQAITMDNILVSGNTVRNNGGSGSMAAPAGIGLRESLNASTINITGNTITNNSGTGSYDDVGGLGINSVSGSEISISNNIIAFNTASGNDRPGGLGLIFANSSIVMLWAEL
jgi:hypothetical protein